MRKLALAVFLGLSVSCRQMSMVSLISNHFRSALKPLVGFELISVAVGCRME